MKKTVFKTLAALVILLIVFFIIVESIIIMEGRNMTKEKVDYVIILGARLYGSIPSPSLLERLKAAKEYLLKNEDVKVVVSGGQGVNEDIPEAFAMRKYLMENGIEDSRILIEDKSTSTFENLKMSLEKIKEVDDRENIKVLIATNRYHVFRARFLAKRLGMIPFGLPAEIPPTTVIKSYIREFFAVIKSFLFDRV
ncbi:MAG TPA: YdcF family protein [Tissierellia bacterium]|nr:YdcF family protein [Tissierellia bacterium]